MNWPYLHLVTNHFPIILALTGTASAVIGFTFRRRLVWLYGLATLTLAGFGVLPAYFSGTEAEEVVEDRPGIVEAALEDHEEAGEAALWVMLAMGGAAAFGWWRGTREEQRGPTPAWLKVGLLTVAVGGAGMIGYTGFLGGKIMHGTDSPGAAAGAADSSRRLEFPSPLIDDATKRPGSS